MAAHQAPPSLGFSRQEHWSGVPLPSPMKESEKWKWSLSVEFDSQQPHGLKPTSLLHPWDFPCKSTGVGCHCLLQNNIVACLTGSCIDTTILWLILIFYKEHKFLWLKLYFKKCLSFQFKEQNLLKRQWKLLKWNCHTPGKHSGSLPFICGVFLKKGPTEAWLQWDIHMELSWSLTLLCFSILPDPKYQTFLRKGYFSVQFWNRWQSMQFP